jgi:hypothetical protein
MDSAWRPSRKSLPLTEGDLRDLSVLRESATHRAVLADLTGAPLSDTSSEAAVLHAIWEAGVKAVLERVEDEGYAQLAAQRDLADRKATARRRRPAWAGEE